jgi:uncharacterized protein
MDINVSQLLQEPVGSTREHDIDEDFDITGDGKNENRIKGHCTMLLTQRSILVKCNLTTELELTCNRCVSQFFQPVKIKFSEEFFPTLDIDTGAALPPPEEASSFTIDEQHILDLTEAIRQYALLAIPMKALCKKDCAGLCAKCGKNLNQGKCDCPQDDIDPRWAKLADLK